MNRALTTFGLLLSLAGFFLFYGVFVNLTPGFIPMLSALILLPIGSGVLFFGAAYKGSLGAPAAAGGGGGAGSGTVWAAVVVAVIAIIIAVASLSVALTVQPSSSTATTTVTTGGTGSSGLSSLGVQPTTVAFKVDWCNTDNTGQDRFCPNQLVVNQGDIVQIMFIHNDTDAHTFTLDTGSYNFQINDSMAGMHDFVSNGNIAGDCSNSGTYSQESAGISGSYCVSGTSLLSPSGNFRIAQNGVPTNSPPALEDVSLNNQVTMINLNNTAGSSEIYGVGAFQATQPGIYEFFCHYHVSNGMFGYLIVLPNAYCISNAASCGLSVAPSNSVSALGVQPTTVAFKVDWCNTDNTGQDRFCPNELVVNQGDTVQVMFIHNDTDAHTFTLDTGSYNFQINDSMAGMHDFVSNGNIAGDCSNSGTYVQQSAGISGTYCVSGTSLMQAGGNFRIAQNGVPTNSPPALEDVPMNNQVTMIYLNNTAGYSEVYGVGSFQATQPGIYEFFCHYHVSNGMFGYLIVLPNAYCISNAASCGLKS